MRRLSPKGCHEGTLSSHQAGESVRSNNAEHSLDPSRLDEQIECLVVVGAMLLGEAADNPTSFVVCKGAISMIFILE